MVHSGGKWGTNKTSHKNQGFSKPPHVLRAALTGPHGVQLVGLFDRSQAGQI